MITAFNLKDVFYLHLIKDGYKMHLIGTRADFLTVFLFF